MRACQWEAKKPLNPKQPTAQQDLFESLVIPGPTAKRSDAAAALSEGQNLGGFLSGIYKGSVKGFTVKVTLMGMHMDASYFACRIRRLSK